MDAAAENAIAQGDLKTRQDSNKCMDVNPHDMNVHMWDCHKGANQDWYWTNGERLKTNHNNKCLDYSTSDNNVIMWDCHSGSNQKWFFDGEHLKTRYDTSKCLDWHMGNGNLYMHACHGGNNQAFYLSGPVRSTTLDDDGGGNLVYWDRHHPQCASGMGMSRWKLDRGGTHNRIKIDYDCASVPVAMGSCSPAQTPLNDDGDGDSRYLDRHNVWCGQNSFLKQWRLSRGGTSDKEQIQYTCCNVPTGLDACEEKETPLQTDGGGDANYLDRHNE